MTFGSVWPSNSEGRLILACSSMTVAAVRRNLCRFHAFNVDAAEHLAELAAHLLNVMGKRWDRMSPLKRKSRKPLSFRD